jgi:hypothetical protein
MSEQERSDDATDVHANKARLFQRGRTTGQLNWDEIVALLPPALVTSEDMQIFLFTCKQMGIEVLGQPTDE